MKPRVSLIRGDDRYENVSRALAQISDEAALRGIIEQVLDQHPAQVEQYLGGKTQVAGWLMGQVMKATKGRANPQLVRSLLTEALEARREAR